MIAETIAMLILLSTVILIGCTALFFPEYPGGRKATFPADAAAIGPDGYMRVWVSGGRVCVVFRNVPRVTVKFDKRAASELAQWLKTIDA